MPDLDFALVDAYGQIVSLNNSKTLSLQPLKLPGAVYTPVISGQTKFVASNGLFFLTGIRFIGDPNSTQIISVQTDAVDLLIPSNQETLNKSRQNITALNITVSLLSCQIGQELMPNGECKICDPGTYNLQVGGNCKRCPSTAVCEGGPSVYPMAGYWRGSNSSENIYECYYAPACLGGLHPQKNLTGNCARGYRGVLCDICGTSFSKFSSSNMCSACPPFAANLAQVVGVYLVFLVLLAVMVRQTIRAAKEKKNLLSVYVRILVNHMQLVLMIASFKMNWATGSGGCFQVLRAPLRILHLDPKY